MGSLLKLITKLFGKNALGKTLGTRTNVIKLPNNEKKRLIKNELDIERASDAAAQKVLEEAKELIPDLPKMNDMERLVFEGNLRRLDNRLNPPSAEVVEFGTKKPMSEAGIKQLAAEKGFPEGVDPESTMGRLLTSTRKLQDEAEKLKTQTPSQQFEDLLKNPYRSGGPLDPTSGIVRTAARQILRKKLDEGQIDIPDAAERDAIAKGYQGGVDPIEVFRKRFGEDPLQDLDEIADELNRARDFKEIDKILKRNKLFDIEPKKDYGYQEGSYTDEEMAALLKKSEEDPEGFAKGGKVEKGSPKIFDQLEMDVPYPYGHRTKFQEGGNFQQFLQDRTREAVQTPGIGQIVSPVLNNLKKWGQHAQASQAMKGKAGLESIPNYGMQSGYDFQKKFPNLDPKISSGLASGYQVLTEGLGMFNPNNPNFMNPKAALATAQSDATKNIEGILAAESNNLTAEQQADRNKYLERVGQPKDPVIDQDRISEIVEQQKAAGVPDEGLITNFNKPTMADVAGPSEVERFKKAYDEAVYGMPSEEVNWYGTGRPNYDKLLAQYKNWNMSDPYFSDPEQGSKFESLFGKSSGYNLASGGRVGFAMGSLPKGIQALAKQLNKKFGKGTIKTADEMERPKSVKEKEMFEEFEARNPDPKRKLTDDEIKDYEEELGDSEIWMSEGTVEEAEQALKRQKEYEAAMYTDYRAGRLDPKPGEKGRKEFLEKKLEEMEMSGDKKIMSVDEIEELSNMDLEAEMNVAKSLAPKMVERFELKQKYPGITDELLDKILIDDNMQRKAEVLATLDEAFKMMEKGMGPDEVLNTIKNVTRTKQAGGGLAYLMGL